MTFVRGRPNPATTYDAFVKTGCVSVNNETGKPCGHKKGYYSVSGGNVGFSMWCCTNCGIETPIYTDKEAMGKHTSEGMGVQPDGSVKLSLRQ